VGTAYKGMLTVCRPGVPTGRDVIIPENAGLDNTIARWGHRNGIALSQNIMKSQGVS
jgi:hypothetical protein